MGPNIPGCFSSLLMQTDLCRRRPLQWIVSHATYGEKRGHLASLAVVLSTPQALFRHNKERGNAHEVRGMWQKDHHVFGARLNQVHLEEGW